MIAGSSKICIKDPLESLHLFEYPMADTNYADLQKQLRKVDDDQCAAAPCIPQWGGKWAGRDS